MKPTKISRRFQSLLPNKLQISEVQLKIFIPLFALAFLSILIWFLGARLTWNAWTPFAKTEQRIYAILSLFMLWFLKFLIVDLSGTKTPILHKNPSIQKQLLQLKNRFLGVLEFFKKTTVAKNGKQIQLTHLPWYLLIGPKNSGKTSMLVRSEVPFILKRQFPNNDIPVSDQCDFWATREACIIDVPGKYIHQLENIDNENITQLHPVSCWRFLLRLIRKYRGNRGLDGIIISLPLAELVTEDSKLYQRIVHDLMQRVFDIQKMFSYSIPCYLIITKCDLLAGFSEFFAEISQDDIVQPCGITLSGERNKSKLTANFTEQFNHLIKKLNQQLLWRLHQERNPMIRPLIKDFPLQVERLKEMVVYFLKKMSASNINIAFEGIYLTSALQVPAKETTLIDDVSNASQRALQIFKQPPSLSRAYFIKHLINHVITYSSVSTGDDSQINWQTRLLYAASAGIIATAVFILAKDFEAGIKQTYVVQNQLSEYKLNLSQTQHLDESLSATIKLLDSLHQYTQQTSSTFDLKRLLSFYSYQSQQKSNLVYEKTLKSVLLPAIQKFLENYLQNPVNRTTDNVYAALKTYIMLSDPSHFQSAYVLETIQQLLPNNLDKTQTDHLLKHLNTALHLKFTPLPLDTDIIVESRNYLTNLPNIKLGYVILKNNNNPLTEINLFQSDTKYSIFKIKQNNASIPTMFTVKSFYGIFSQQALAASEEAIFGNWVLGEIQNANRAPQVANSLVQQLRTLYVTDYMNLWENLLANVDIIDAKDLSQVDNVVKTLASDHSPLIGLLQTLHENTYFEPIISSSPRLQNLGLLLDKNQAANGQIYQIQSSLNAIHEMLQTILSASDEQKAAFEIVSARAKNPGRIDALTQLRLIAAKSPEPIKNWLNKLAADVWHLILSESIRYMDTSWQNEVIRVYQNDIANHYPFSANAQQEVALKEFINFFGTPGTLSNFYDRYLKNLVDTTTTEWRWKSIDDNKLPLSDDILKQIQQAMRIQHTFFPNGDAKPYLSFSLQPYNFDKHIKSVCLSMNDKHLMTDNNNHLKNPHTIIWPSNNLNADSKWNMTSVQLTMMDDKTIIRNFSGDWGWFRMINQSFENVLSEKQMLINLSRNSQPARYLISTKGESNPFLSLNLPHFHLSSQLTNNDSA